MSKNVNFNINAGVLGTIIGSSMVAAAGAGFAGGLFFSRKLHERAAAPFEEFEIDEELEDVEDDSES